MKYTILLLLLCGGCATPITELRAEADACEKETPKHCKPLWDVYMKQLENEDKMLRQRNLTCPPGMIMVTDGWDRSSCYQRGEVERFLRGGLF